MMINADIVTNRMLLRDNIYIKHKKITKQTNLHPHSHNGYEIYLFLSGKATYIIGDCIYQLEPGDMLTFNGDQLHYVKPNFSIPYVRTVVNFTNDYITSFLSGTVFQKIESLFIRQGGNLIHWNNEEKVELEKILALIAQEDDDRSDGYEEMMRSYFSILLMKILRKNYSEYSKPRDFYTNQRELHVERVLGFINQRYRETVSLDDIASEIHLNKYYLCHSFKSVTGLTINQYFIKRRIDEGKKLLEETDRPISIIAEDIGFGGIAQFSRLFKQHVGVSPKTFRRGFIG